MTDINELIDMAWSDDVTFSDIEKTTGLKESSVKRIMQANLKPSSYKLWRNRVRWIKEKRKKIKELSEGLKVRVTRIGVINNQKELEIVGYSGPKSSYQHFR